MRSTRVTRLLTMSAAVAALVCGSVASSSSPAQAATCTTINLGSEPFSVVRPWMSIPICYDGSRVWQNGNPTGNVTTVGYYLNGISWMGTYGGGNWLGAGMNYSVTLWTGGFSIGCATRWGIDAHGNVISYNRGCRF